MANEEHLERIKKGSVEEWNRWREENPIVKPSLERVMIIGKKLSGINLSRSYLNHARFFSCDLSGASLRKAILLGTHMQNVNFEKANFQSSRLSHCILAASDFTKANMNRVELSFGILASCNLTDAKVSGCIHRSPSMIDHQTLALSGNLPVEFLRGCGLPDFIIDNIDVLRGDAVQIYSCFISYSSKDEEFANRLYADLQNNGVRCWFAPEEMKGGQKLYDQINQAIRLHDKLLLILSEHSMNSTWVETEIQRARRRERQEGRQLLFPIRLTSYEALQNWELFDSDEGRDLAAEVRAYFIPDFSNWNNHDDYQSALGKLLDDLKNSK